MFGCWVGHNPTGVAVGVGIIQVREKQSCGVNQADPKTKPNKFHASLPFSIMSRARRQSFEFRHGDDALADTLDICQQFFLRLDRFRHFFYRLDGALHFPNGPLL